MTDITRYYFLLLVLLAPSLVEAQVSFCFKSSDKNNLNLQFTVIDKDWKYGFVKYNHPEYAIPVKRNNEQPDLDHPALTRYNWDEIVNDSVTGVYSFVLQGDSFRDVTYVRAKDKKKFRFERVNAGARGCECDW